MAKDIQADVLAAVTTAQWAAVALRVAAKAAKHNQRRAYHDAVARIKLAVLQKALTPMPQPPRWPIWTFNLIRRARPIDWPPRRPSSGA
ncbi:hypothetical protein [Lacticaseibacillus nasuensis]|uniref:hypothetical protein n=1 Tax=Lacticaseibacillus nasuensis TaxID=944671 RepID=UPI0006D12CB7|nr:hypothetical protein [Lacticaseibacillus nasuensis]